MVEIEFKSTMGYHVFNYQILMTKNLIAAWDGEAVRKQSFLTILSIKIDIFLMEGNLAISVLNVYTLLASSSTIMQFL